jgi:hypothetical protein
MTPQQYRPSSRSWIKLWVNEWLTGTVRWQLTPQQRSIWADLLALAGRSRFPGIVCSGETNGTLEPFPMDYLCSVFRCSLKDAKAAFELYKAQGRISIDKTGVIQIVNWDKYQSEYQQKRQRTAYKAAKSISNVRKKSAVEVEGDKEGEKSSPRLDDLKKSFLAKCQDPQGIIAAIVEIVCERAAKSGVKIRTEKYIQKAVESFDTESGQDKEELQHRLRTVPL